MSQLVIRRSLPHVQLMPMIIVFAAMIIGPFAIAVLPLSIVIGGTIVLAILIGTSLEPGIG
ncbi:MAG TPA: hypothetical protein VII92_14280, partial [Anaerolineae bacterium]